MTTTSTIAEQVTGYHRASAGQLPAEVAEAFTTEQRALAAAGEPSGVGQPGIPLPDGELLDVAGQPVTLAQTLSGRAAVIVFYRGGWCPYCNIALRTYQAQLVPALAERGIGLVAISPQVPDGSLSTKETKELTFTVLSDPGNQIARQLGILTAPSDGTRAAQLTTASSSSHSTSSSTASTGSADRPVGRILRVHGVPGDAAGGRRGHRTAVRRPGRHPHRPADGRSPG